MIARQGRNAQANRNESLQRDGRHFRRSSDWIACASGPPTYRSTHTRRQCASRRAIGQGADRVRVVEVRESDRRRGRAYGNTGPLRVSKSVLFPVTSKMFSAAVPTVSAPVPPTRTIRPPKWMNVAAEASLLKLTVSFPSPAFNVTVPPNVVGLLRAPAVSADAISTNRLSFPVPRSISEVPATPTSSIPTASTPAPVLTVNALPT